MSLKTNRSTLADVVILRSPGVLPAASGAVDTVGHAPQGGRSSRWGD